MRDPASCLPAGVVRVWHADVDVFRRHPTLVPRWRERLAPAEHDRFARFRRDVDREMFLLGRAMARVLVAEALGCEPWHWPWQESARGRPEVGVPESPIRFNLAHSAGLVVCALAAGRDVGVDVEDRQRRPPHPDMVERYCAPDEVRDIRAAGDGWQERFLTYWTLKEAYLKARGLGIAVQLRDMTFSIRDDGAAIAFHGALAGTDDRWRFRIDRPTERHLLAVAAAAPDEIVPDVRIQPLPAGRLQPA